MREHVLRRLVSPPLFALVGLAFLLPFATVSCDDARTIFTGVQLVTHTVPVLAVLHAALALEARRRRRSLEAVLPPPGPAGESPS